MTSRATSRTRPAIYPQGHRSATWNPGRAEGRDVIEQETGAWKTVYRARAGIEGTISQNVAVTGIRHARYAGLPKLELEHAFAATAINLINLDA